MNKLICSTESIKLVVSIGGKEFTPTLLQIIAWGMTGDFRALEGK